MVNTQDFNNSFYRDIDMVRGDTLCFNFELSGLESKSVYESLNIRFAVAETYESDAKVSCSNDNDGISLINYDSSEDKALFSVYMNPIKSATLEVNRYYYDLQISNTDNVITLLRGRLSVLYDVQE